MHCLDTLFRKLQVYQGWSLSDTEVLLEVREDCGDCRDDRLLLGRKLIASTEYNRALLCGTENGSRWITEPVAGADKKGGYVGIHSTDSRDFVLKPELPRAITSLA